MNNYLSHYGVKGMKWGVRRYEKDGSLTPYGKRNADKLFNDDGSLSKIGKSHIISIDGSDKQAIGNNVSYGARYAHKWTEDYGEVPLNRIRFMNTPGQRIGNRVDGDSYDFDWNNTRMSDIYDAYDDYKRTLDWD